MRKLTPEEALVALERRRKAGREAMRRLSQKPGMREEFARRTRERRKLHGDEMRASQRARYWKNRDKRVAAAREYYTQATVYRVVAEEMIGRKLVKGEAVHHIDCDRSNNAAENLHVMTASQHIRAHTTLNALAKELMARGIVAYDRDSMTYRLT